MSRSIIFPLQGGLMRPFSYRFQDLKTIPQGAGRVGPDIVGPRGFRELFRGQAGCTGLQGGAINQLSQKPLPG